MQEPGGGVTSPRHIYRLPDEIEMKFQQLPPIFGVELFNGALFTETIRLLLPEIQDFGR